MENFKENLVSLAYCINNTGATIYFIFAYFSSKVLQCIGGSEIYAEEMIFLINYNKNLSFEFVSQDVRQLGLLQVTKVLLLHTIAVPNFLRCNNVNKRMPDILNRKLLKVFRLVYLW